MATFDPDYATVATWDGGYVLQRILTDAGMETVAVQGKVTEKLPSFIFWKGYSPLFWFRVDPGIRNVWPLRMSETQTPSLEDRAVLFSALIEVIGVSPGQRQQTILANVDPFDEKLQPVLVKPARLQEGLQEEQRLVPISEELEAVYPSELAKVGMQRKELWRLRKLYQNEGAEIVRRLRLGKLSRMMDLMSSPALGRDLAPDLPRYPSPLDYTKAQLGHSNHWLVLTLNMIPQPTWDVFVVQMPPRGWSTSIDFTRPRLWLAQGASGPVTALLQAGLLLPDAPGELEQWTADLVADAPEPHIVFDIEPYRLLDADSPLLWPLSRFVEWFSALEVSTSP